jgi:hypothetical protein
VESSLINSRRSPNFLLLLEALHIKYRSPTLNSGLKARKELKLFHNLTPTFYHTPALQTCYGSLIETSVWWCHALPTSQDISCNIVTLVLVSWLLSIKSKYHEIVLALFCFNLYLGFQDVNLLIIFCFLFFEIVLCCYCFLTMSMTMLPHIWHFRYNTNSIVFQYIASLPPSFCTEFLRTGWLTQHSLRLNFKTLLFKTTMSNGILALDSRIDISYFPIVNSQSILYQWYGSTTFWRPPLDTRTLEQQIHGSTFHIFRSWIPSPSVTNGTDRQHFWGLP